MQENSHRLRSRGRSYRGQDLTGKDFSYLDIRGADFTNATLVGVDFNHAEAGLQRRWLFILVILGLILSILSGLLSAYASTSVSTYLFPEKDFWIELLSSTITLFFLFGFLVLSIRQGLKPSIGILALVIVAIIILFLFGIPGHFLNSTPDKESYWSLVIALVIFQPLMIAGAIAGVLGEALAYALTTNTIGILAIFISGGGYLAGSVLGALEGVKKSSSALPVLVVGGTITLFLLLFSVYIGKQALREDTRYSLIKVATISISTWRGTCFRGANLTDANFSKAILKHTDLRRAKLIRTFWYHAKGLKQALTWETYLNNLRVRDLVITSNGADQEFEHLDLQGLNLQSADLRGISFIGSNLSESNLRHANLLYAKLVGTQFYRALLTHACLTGAYIQDWGISPETKLEEIECEYIYMRLPTDKNPEPWRKPDNREEIFQKGDFSTFIAPIIKTLDLYRYQNVDPREVTINLNTLDLYHHQGVDPGAAAIAFDQLAEEYPEADPEVIAIEGRGEDKIRIQVKVSDEANRSELNKAYFLKYDQLQRLSYLDLQSLLASSVEKDERIQSLERMLTTALGSNKFYIENLRNWRGTVSEINIESSGNVSGIVGGDIKDVSGVVNLSAISGDVTNAIGQLPDSLQDKSRLKDLLTQLQSAIEAEPALSEEDKAEALEQLKTLAQVGQKPEEVASKKMAKTAVKILKGTVSGLPTAAKLIEEFNKLIPTITSLLGLG